MSINPGSIKPLQVLRGIASISVVVHHTIRAYTINKPDFLAALPNPIMGTAWFRDSLAVGVDIFFVISGFIMVYISSPYTARKKPTSNFIFMRLIRIYPPYFLVLFLSIFIIIHDSMGRIPDFDFSLARIFGATTLFPTYNETGAVQPIIGVGWTLSYEVYFYLSISIAIEFFKKNFLPYLCGSLMIVFALSHLPSAHLAIIDFLRSPIIIEFIFGCVLGSIYLEKGLYRIKFLHVIIAVIVIFYSGYKTPDMYNSQFRFVYWGIPSLIIVWYTVNFSYGLESRAKRFMLALGDSSYSIYLIHLIIIYNMILPVLRHIASGTFRGENVVLISASIVAAIAGGTIFHFYIEKPLLVRVRSLTAT